MHNVHLSDFYRFTLNVSALCQRIKSQRHKLFSPYLGSKEVIPAEDLIKDVPHQLLAPGGGEPVPGPEVQHAGQDVLEEGGQQRQVDAAPHGAQVALGGADGQILDE